MSAVEHDLYLTDAFSEYFVECSCGWKGSKGFATKSAAIDDWCDHRDAVFMEATTAGDDQ